MASLFKVVATKAFKSRKELLNLLKSSTLLSSKILLREGADVLITYFHAIKSDADIVTVRHGTVLKKINVPKVAILGLNLLPETRELLKDPTHEVVVIVVKNRNPGEAILIEPWKRPLGKMGPFSIRKETT